MVKHVRISEKNDFDIRVDVVNVLNTPRWRGPKTNMNSVSFGRLVASDPSRSFQQSDVVKGARTFTITARVNF